MVNPVLHKPLIIAVKVGLGREEGKVCQVKKTVHVFYQSTSGAIQGDVNPKPLFPGNAQLELENGYAYMWSSEHLYQIFIYFLYKGTSRSVYITVIC